MVLNQLEEPHQLILLRKTKTPVLKNGGPRVRYAPEFPILAANKARINALELHVLIRTRFQNEVDGFVRAEQNPRSTKVDVEASGMVREGFGGKRGNLNVGVERARSEIYCGVFQAIAVGSGELGFGRGRMGIEERGEV